jgi:hypothetical protein
MFIIYIYIVYNIYRVNEKCMAKPTKRNLHCNTRKKNYMNICLLYHGFKVMASWQLNEMFKVSAFSFHASTTGDRLLRPYFLPRLAGAAYHDLLQNVLPELLQDVVCTLWLIYGLCMMMLHIFFLQFRNSWATCFQNNRHNEVDQQHGPFIPRNKFLRFLSLGTCEYYCLCYRSQCHPGLATTNTKCIWDGLYDTWNFPAIQTITVWTYNILHWSSRLTLWTSSLVFTKP